MPDLIKEYFAVTNSLFTRADAAIIGPQLQELADTGVVTPASVVEVAKSANSPLHAFFEWDDQTAANHYRLSQAEGMVRAIRVRLISGEDLPAATKVRIKVADAPPPPRVPMQRHIGVLDDKSEQAEDRAREALATLQSWADRYRKYAVTWKRFGYVFNPVLTSIAQAEQAIATLRQNPQLAGDHPAPFKAGELPASLLVRRERTETPAGLHRMPPEAQRAAQQLAARKKLPAQIIDGKFRIGSEVFTPDTIIAAARALNEPEPDPANIAITK